MRIFKFRAWDKIDKIMRYENNVDGSKEWPSLLAVGFHGLPICIDKDCFKENEIIAWNRDHNLTLMQFTGLYDKNGKEVYEGDIIRSYNEYGDAFAKLSVVTYDEGIATYHGFDVECSDYEEIIGNIYENPELLKEESA